MTHAQAHREGLEMIKKDMMLYVIFDQKAEMFQLLLEEFCGMDNDKALETLFWILEDPFERATLMITINTHTKPR